MTHIDHSEKVFAMRIFLTFLTLIIGLQSFCKADDIRDFQLEGMSIGDSLLDYFSKKEIEKNKIFEKEQGNNKEVSRYYITKNVGNYEWIAASFKTNDKKYLIIEISGFLFLPFEECLKKRDKIDLEMKKMFSNSERQESGTVQHFIDKNSLTNNIYYWTSKSSNDVIAFSCYDWSKESGYKDQLRVEVYSDEYHKWLGTLEK